MGAGLQIWNAAGQLIFDTPDRMGRIVGTVDTGGVGGSVTFTVPPGCTPFWFTSVAPQLGGVPKVSLSGSTITWLGGVTATIFYGYY